MTSATGRFLSAALVAILTVVLLVAGSPASAASVSAAAEPQAVDLASAEAFAVLAGAMVSNTGPSVINGDVGVSPGTAVTGFPPGIVNGEIHRADAVAAQAQADLTVAYNDAAGRPPTATEDTELGGETLVPGVYDSETGTFGITGTLTLDGQGDPNAVFIFQADSTLITASGSSVNLIGGATACNVFWQVGSSATLGTNSIFKGTILALTSITVTTGTTVDGGLLARNGAVTLDDNTVTSCEGGASVDITKVADDATIEGGNAMGFTITVRSNGPGEADDVMVTDPLPMTPGTSWTIDAGTGAAFCAITSGTLTCDFGSMPPRTKFTVHITSPTTKESKGTTTNTASVNSSNGGSDEAQATVTVICPLRLTVRRDAPEVAVGSQMGFTVTVRSLAASHHHDVNLQSSLPAGRWSIDPASSPGCSISNRVLSCALGELEADESRSVHLTATAREQSRVTLRVQATTADCPYRHTATNSVTVV